MKLPNPTYNRQALLIFIKNPLPGKAKNKLAASVGKMHAYEIFLKILIRMHKVFVGLAGKKIVYYRDWINHNDLWSEAEFDKKQQHGNHLGERLKNAIAETLMEGYDKIVVVGCDIPDLNSGFINQAFQMLDTYDYVLGPSNDGSFYLFGVNGIIDNVFNFPCEKNMIYQHFITYFNEHKLTCYVLPELVSVDTIDDFHKTHYYAALSEW